MLGGWDNGMFYDLTRFYCLLLIKELIIYYMCLLFVVDLKRKNKRWKNVIHHRTSIICFFYVQRCSDHAIVEWADVLVHDFYEAGASDGTNPDSNVFACYIQACDLFVLS